MRGLFVCAVAAAVLSAIASQGQSAFAQDRSSAKERLIGGWRLVSMEEPGADGKMKHVTDRKGELIYTRDGHMSVQIMYPASESNVSNDYVVNGYEASFGSYDVDETRHTVTHHVQASVTRGLVGKHLARRYKFSGGHLIVTSTRADEHWSVTWEHY